MSEVDDLFNEAYKLEVLEEKPREAIELCRRALELDPDNYRVRVFLGMLLAITAARKRYRKAGNILSTPSRKQKRLPIFARLGPKRPLSTIWVFGSSDKTIVTRLASTS
jgi:tetratricopeptide (TPR) repeat protein